MLKNGMVVFIAEDRALPLVNIALTVRTGSYLEPAGKEGLAGLTGSQIRRGGTKSLTAEELDERSTSWPPRSRTGIGATAGSASLNCLADNLDESLKLFVEMLKEPRFQEDRLALAKEQALQEMKKRNDDSEDIEAREWNVLLYGETHFTNRFTTEASVKVDHPRRPRRLPPAFLPSGQHGGRGVGRLLPGGDDPEAGSRVRATGRSRARRCRRVPGTIEPAAPGLYRMQKDVNQGRVSIGLPTVKRDSPDVYALEVMNEILGGSGFTSRITKSGALGRRARLLRGLRPRLRRLLSRALPRRVPVEEPHRGLRDRARPGGDQEDARRRRSAREELDTIKSNLDRDLPQQLRLEGAGDGHLRRRRVHGARARLLDDLPRPHPGRHRGRRAARGHDSYLVPEKMIVLVVGDQKEIDLGDGKHDVNLRGARPGRQGRRTLPLRDPLTMKRP